jgi:hypothetical protein
MVHLKTNHSPDPDLMNTSKALFFGLLVSLFCMTISCAQKKPTVTLNPTRVLHSGTVQMEGSGFSPNSNVFSHLRRPDGTQFPVLPMRANEKGEFHHEIDTLLLSPGVHEVWVEDDKTKTTSDVVRFEVTNDLK